MRTTPTNDTDMPDVPFTVHQSDMARLERANRRLAVIAIVQGLALIISLLR